MKPPKHVVVGNHTYRVRSGALTSEQLASDAKYGDTQVARLLIRVDRSRPHTLVAETLLHELLHAVFDGTSLRVRDDDEEELIVTAIAPLLLEMIRANPELVAFLTAASDDT